MTLVFNPDSVIGLRLTIFIPIRLSQIIRVAIALFSAALFACGTVFAQAVDPIPAENSPVILIMGDSISAAYAMEQSESWPALLSNRLKQHGYAYRVFNSSIAGDTTEGGLARLPRLLASQQAAVVIIELGGNDGLRGLSLDVTRSNLQSMITQSQQAGAAVVIAGIQLPPNYGQTYTERFSALFSELAQEFSTAYIPFILENIALDPALMQEDGIHPNIQAQPIILEHVWLALEPLLHELQK